MNTHFKQIFLTPAEDDTWPPRADHDSFWGLRRSSHKWRPATDLYETEDAYRVQVEIAGMRGAEFSVTFEGQDLVITGSRQDMSSSKAYHQMEIGYGEFETTVHIPEPVDAHAIEASYADGFLNVALPKARPRKVAIE